MTTSSPLPLPAQRLAVPWKRLAWMLLPPLGTWLLARAVLILAALQARAEPLRAASWAKWDSAHYLSIARHGYILHPCGPAFGGPANWCGNAGWMPGYPALLTGPIAAGVPGELAGVVASALFGLALLQLLWTAFLRQQPSRLPVLLLAALFPGQVYQHAVFPISICLFFALLCLHLQERRRPVLAGLAGGAAAFTYTTGFLLAPVVLLAELLGPAPERGPLAVHARRAAIVCAGVAVGYGAALAVFQLQAGAWNALFLTAAKYGVGLHDPLSTLTTVVQPLASMVHAPNLRAAPPAQTAFVALLVVLLVGWTLARWRTTGLRERWLVLYGLAFWTFPLVMGTGVSLYRAEALLAPLVLLVPGPRTAVAALAGSAALAYTMGQLFFLGILV